METEIINHSFQVEKYIPYDRKEIINQKESWFCKKDSNTNYSTDEISINSNQEIFVEENKFDFQIPNFLNDQPKIFIRNRTIPPLIPDWYKNLNKFKLDFSICNDESLFH